MTSVRRVCDAVAARLETRLERLLLPPPAYRPEPWERVVDALGRALAVDADALLAEPALAAIEEEIRRGIAATPSPPPLPIIHNADFRLARLCYLVCRAVRPAVVVETGVAYGVTSSFFLQALAMNEHGVLHSVDRAPFVPDAAAHVGSLVPRRLRGRWTLYRGASGRILPRLLPRLGAVGIFLHDSRHTYRNIARELRTVTPFLARPGLVLADDIQRNAAFEAWRRRARPAYWATVAEADKDSVFGVGAFPACSG